MFESDSLPAADLSRDGAQTRYSVRDTSHTKHPDYLYLSDNATAPSSGDLIDKQPTLTRVTLAAGIHQPKRHIKQEDLLHLEQFPSSQFFGASQIAAHPLNAGHSFPALEQCSQTCGKSKKKVGRPLKYEEAADSPNMTEAEKRKLRRRTANRESACRVRDRRTQHSGVLEAKVAAVAATHDQLAKQIAHVEGERHLASSLCQTFHSKLSALQQVNEGLALEVKRLEHSVEQEVLLIDVRSNAHTSAIGNAPISAIPASLQPLASQTNNDLTVPVVPSSATGPSAFASGTADTSEPLDVMLTLLDQDVPDVSMQRQSSLTLSRGPSVMLDLFYNHGKEECRMTCADGMLSTDSPVSIRESLCTGSETYQT